MKLSEFFEQRYLPYAKRHLKPKTVEEYDRLAKKLVLPKFGKWEMHEITFSEAEDWHADLGDTPVQANRALAALSSVLGYGARRQVLPANPCRGIRRNKERKTEFFYMPDQSQAIVKAAIEFPDIRGKYIALTLLTGARPGELLESTPSWRHGNVLRTPDGKTGGRTIYLPPAACAILDGLPVLRVPHHGGYVRRWFPSDMDLRRAWTRILCAAEVPPARIYDLRHTFASSALAAGVPLDIVGMLLGHKKGETTRRYAHLAPDTGLSAAAAAAVRMGVSK